MKTGVGASLRSTSAAATTTRDDPYLNRLAEVRYDPVFVMGDHRSGTTLLCQLLYGSGCFNAVTAYHLICYKELLYNHFSGEECAAKEFLGNRFAAAGLSDRLIDGVQVSPDLPEEYGFLVKDAGPRPQMLSATLPRLTELFSKVQLISMPGRPLLLKNPWDSMNFVRVKHFLPTARFVFIHRDPVHVISSQLRAMRSLFAEKNGYVALIDPWYARLFGNPIQLAMTRLLAAQRFGLGTAIALGHVRKVTDYYLQNIGHLSPEDHVVIRYEDLCAAPDATMGIVLAFLGVQPAALRSYSGYIHSRPAQLLPEVVAQAERVRKALAGYCAQFGYDSV